MKSVTDMARFGRKNNYNSSYDGNNSNYKENGAFHWIYRIVNILYFIFFVLVLVNYTIGVVLGPFNKIEAVIYSQYLLTYATPER